MDHLPGDGLKYRKNNNNYKENGLHDNENKLNNKSDDIQKGKVIGLVFVSLLLDLLAFTMILPLLPSLLDYYDKEEGKGNSLYASLVYAVRSFQKLTGAPDRFASVLFGGALGSMYSFLQFLTSPIVGSLSDAYGRKPMLLICLLGIAVSHALWSCASTFSMFVLARFIGGLSKANVSLSMAIVTDASGEKTRARGMALVGLAFSIGFIVGPMAGAWFAMTTDTNFGLWGQRPALYALSLSLANIALVSLFLPETLSKDKRAPLSLSLSKAIEYVSPWHLLKFSAVENLSQHQNKVLSNLGLIYFLYLFIYSGLEFTITFLTHHTFAYTAMQQGKMFLVIGVIMAVLQGGAARRLGPRGAETAARLALALTPASFLCVALAASADPVLLSPITWLWAGLVLFALSTAFAVSCMTSLAAAQAPAGARGAVLGALRSLGALARAAGPLLASAASGRAGAAHKENLRLKKELEQLEEENNMLRLKFEILLDMMTDKTVEAEQQQQEDMQRAQSLSSLKKTKKQKW
ncbi:major facilitator superfamily domain-containing protein 10 isoform X2 [Papilio machaon]|uniref:major facilitator superfamily domain-containing protein 10 isoform X2 n=1 Tax=Papilio machaon TaxID=76193 RepID=UPI001E664307|nr:major facilitator superfamily domain-containing protein 10 isoform X2 [Papilio machaon]